MELAPEPDAASIISPSVPPAAPPYIADIRAQPTVLETLLGAGIPAEPRALLGSIATFDRIVLTGMGSSLNGMYPTYLRLAAAGLATWCEDTAELLGYERGLMTGNTLVWLTSQSGESAEAVELLDRVIRPGGPTVLAATNDPDSSLGTRAHVVMPLHSGPENTVGTRSYVNTLALGTMASSIALGIPVDPEVYTAPENIARYLDDWDDHLSMISAEVPDSSIFVLGRGSSLASARTAALIAKEAARRPVEGMSVPQFRHGPLEMADHDLTALVFAGNPAERVLNEQMRTDLIATGARCVWVDTAPAVRPPVGATIVTPALPGYDARPLAEIVPMQLLTVVLAERSGQEPGRFRQIDKITRTL